MNKKNNEARKIGLRIVIGLLLLVVALVIGFYVYTLDYYRASDYVTEIMEQSPLNMVTKGRVTTIYPTEANDLHTGFIFYPGGKVEAKAYMPLLIQLAEEGLTCILVEMPMNLAVFDIKAADDLFEAYPSIEGWHIAGHSLGGAMASSYLEDHYEKVDGLILMGAYPLNDAPVDTLVIYGSEDVVLDLSKLVDTKNQVEIVGGNHAWFGDYGEQEGDGKAVISRQEQQSITVEAIISFIQ